MEKRVFLAILLSFVVLAGYQAWFAPTPAPQRSQAPGTAGSATPPAPQGLASGMGSSPEVADGASAVEAPAAAPLVADTVARQIVVETDTVRAVFSTAGATLESWTLKRYLEGGQPLDLIPHDIPAAYARAFSVSTTDAGVSRTLASALFKPSADQLTLGAQPGQLTFEYRDASGLNARKTFYFQPEGKPYVLKVEAAVDRGGASLPVSITSGPAPGLGYQPDGSRHTPTRALQHTGGKVARLAASDLEKQSRYEGEFKYAGADDQYFLSAALPGSQRVAVHYEPISLSVPNDSKNEQRTFVSYTVSVPGSFAMPFYLGPKQFDTLRNVDSRLELVRAIDFGMFAIIVVPLLQALTWVHGFIGNYGWSIVTLTLIINLLMFPFRHTSMVSMKKMQAAQPELKAIQERYAKYKMTDPERQKMNQEMMALYKQRGINPVSGCLPMLATLPVLLAFYALLSGAIELRGAPFFGWLTDLSRHDPYYVTPILMGLSMLVQQKMMPSTADPIQQKLFLMMPVIFTVSFLWAPSGLVVYWFVSNLLAIGQQLLTNRMVGGPATAGRPAAARRS